MTCEGRPGVCGSELLEAMAGVLVAAARILSCQLDVVRTDPASGAVPEAARPGVERPAGREVRRRSRRRVADLVGVFQTLFALRGETLPAAARRLGWLEERVESLLESPSELLSSEALQLADDLGLGLHKLFDLLGPPEEEPERPEV